MSPWRKSQTFPVYTFLSKEVHSSFISMTVYVRNYMCGICTYALSNVDAAFTHTLSGADVRINILNSFKTFSADKLGPLKKYSPTEDVTTEFLAGRPFACLRSFKTRFLRFTETT